jgi:Skp family chaperone for outer membrane proteins
MLRTSFRRALVSAGLAILASGGVGALAQTGQPGNQPLAVPVPDSALGGSRPAAPGAGTAPPSGPSAPSASSTVPTAVPIPVIMVVDIEGVIAESKAYKSIQGQMDGLRQSAEKEFAGKKNEMEKDAADFQRDARAGQVPAAEIEERRHALVLRQDELQKEADTRRQSLQTAYANAVEKVKQELFTIVTGLAGERRANLILLRSAAIPLDRSFEVSKEALTRLDGKLSAVTVTMPAATAPAAGTAPPAKKK